MSQWLLVSYRKDVGPADRRYDAVYDENGSLHVLLCDWLSYIEDWEMYFGPWAVVIRTFDFFDRFLEDFSKIKEHCPRLTSLKDCRTVWDEKNGRSLWGDPVANEKI